MRLFLLLGFRLSLRSFLKPTALVFIGLSFFVLSELTDVLATIRLSNVSVPLVGIAGVALNPFQLAIYQTIERQIC